jgi:hypothetical protein
LNEKLYNAMLDVAKHMVANAEMGFMNRPYMLVAEGEAKPKITPEVQARIDAMQKEDDALKKKLNRYAADPELRENMMPWMMDFHGGQEPEWVKNRTLPPEFQSGDLQGGPSVRVSYAELPCKVRDVLEANGFKISDSGSGCGGWDLGVLCSDKDTAWLGGVIQAHFREYIEAGVLDVQLKFWGWRFREIRNLQGAEAFLKTRAAS